MRIHALLMVLALAPSVARAAPTCPPGIRVQENAAAPLADWTVGSTPLPHALAGMAVFDGPPAERAQLKHDGERTSQAETARYWNLRESPRGHWVRCEYANTGVTLDQAVPADVRYCEVVRDRDARLGDNRLAVKRMRCGAPYGTKEAQPVLRGMLSIDGGARSFKSCGRGRDYWVTDETGGDLEKVYGEYAPAAGKPVFVELRAEVTNSSRDGPAAQFERTLTVSEIRRAEKEGPGCRNNLRHVEFRALGNEPSWRLDVSRLGTTFATLEAPTPLKFAYRASVAGGQARRYEGAENGHDFTFTVRAGPCRDKMAGNLFPFTAVVQIDGREYRGCAYDGDAAR